MFYDSFNFDAVFVASGVAIYSSLVSHLASCILVNVVLSLL